MRFLRRPHPGDVVSLTENEGGPRYPSRTSLKRVRYRTRGSGSRLCTAVRLASLIAASACADDDPFPSLRTGGECAPPTATSGTCQHDADCTGVCGRDPSLGPSDGEPTTLRCLAGTPGDGLCASASDCVRGLCSVSGRCVVPCRDEAHCGPGERCGVVHVRVGSATERVDACFAEVTTWPEVIATRTRLEGAFPPVSLPTVTVDVPFGAVASFLSDCSAGRVRVESVIDTGDPSPWFERSNPSGSRQPVSPNARPVSFLFPSSPTFGPPAGPVRALLSAEGPGGITAFTFRRAMPSGGRLDVDLYYVGGGGFVATGTHGPAPVAAALGDLEERFREAGVRVGQVRQHDVVGTLAEGLSIVEREAGAWPELATLGALTAGEPTPSISVFFVRLIDGALALSGGTPGPAAIDGTSGSVVALAVDAIGVGQLSRALSHEVGHHFGLFHTTEPFGVTTEAIEDTPVCTLEQDADGDGMLSLSECRDAGASNLMFWAIGGDDITTGQAQVVASSPLLGVFE